MPHILQNPGKRRLIATAIGAALLSTFPQLTFAADGQAGGPATASDSAQGGGGGTMDTTTGIGGNGGNGGAGDRGQSSSQGENGGAGSVDGVTNSLPAGTATGGEGHQSDGSTTTGNGSAGGGGGGGSAGKVLNGSSGDNSGDIKGGNGGRGGNGGSNTTDVPEAGNGGNGGDGGDGGAGVLITGTGSYTNGGSITGGDGGNGGNTGSATANDQTEAGETLHGGSGGAGGAGGDGVMLTQGGSVTNTGTIAGGHGATGGLAANADTEDNENVTGVGGSGGEAADGGSGVWLSGTSTITNSGSILGGDGGDGGNGGAVESGQGTGVVGYGSAGGNGGSGITVEGSGKVINNSGGHIVGGNAGTGGGGNSNSSGDNLTGGDGGDGGKGGSGIELEGGGSVSNFGEVTGGLGNRGGGSGNLSTSQGGDSGAGGTGIEINGGGDVINESSGVVTGGKGGDDSAGGGGVGGAGGDAVSIVGAGNVTNHGAFVGGNGGAGANGNSPTSDGGTGAKGGNGLSIEGNGTLTNDAGASITGGLGGTGGGSGGDTSHGGSGGEGGSGVLIGAGGQVINNGDILGGTGNRGGGGGGDAGGAGGAGISITSGGGSVVNTGTISGGNGGEPGTAGAVNGVGDVGAGGVGISGSDMTIVNSGTITGGMDFDGQNRSQAIVFTGGTNSLELRAGYNVQGTVQATAGDDTLILGGDSASQFDAANIGDSAQYQGFEHFHKTGASTWVLNNTTAAATPWTLYDGILQIAQNGALGSDSSLLTFDGGTLQVTNSFDLDRPITLESGGGTLDTQGFNTTLNQGVTGSGDLTKLGSGMLTMTGDSTYTGATTLAEGSLDVTGSLVSDVTAKSATLLSGTGSIGAATLETGSTLTVGSPLQGNDDAASFTINGDLDNSGIVNLSRNANITGNRLNVSGDYIGGTDSQLNVNTVLGDDASVTDKLVIQGATSGATVLNVSNVGGQGAQTEQGIEVVTVGGDSASGAFTQSGRIVAGAWDYSLVQKGQNWYLTSMSNLPPVKPTEPEPVPVYRPEAGSYLVNLTAANTLFNLTLDDREGATEYRAPLDERGMARSTFWLRQEGGQNRFHTGEGQISSSANRYVAQMGNEFLHGTSNQTDRWGAGLMAGYGNVQGNSRSNLTGYRSESEMDGYSVGAYGTWYQNAVSREGVYVDGWVMYNWFNNHVSGDDLQNEDYKSRGFTASLESGYNMLLSESERQAVYLEPQAQLTWMGVHSAEHTEANGTRVQDSGQGSLQSRLGVRLYLRGHRQEDDGKGREFKPYVEADWLHNTKNFGVRMGDKLLNEEGARNIGQLKLGVQGQITHDLNMWGGVAQQIGDKGYHDTSAMIGVKYGF
ncbi:autotransporter outer membrane beta-barrel domain-containing protein [Cedecea neteri]|uniref:autotransporter outer membrane beta-barrel domain-containing protein n=1 Tax=Cedecea neteri TaxID=158822 RepID=UPI002AA762F1|nr:autotransporter outer membrane beta-barrel domain-containing protein [Cedecea neteri]WPU23956.1 autotransporter outer membrane beta-barrel domain-containing protein [Cedecea neteri]